MSLEANVQGLLKIVSSLPFLPDCCAWTTVYVSKRLGSGAGWPRLGKSSDHCSSLVFPDPRGEASLEGNLIALLSFCLFSIKPLVTVLKKTVTFGQSWPRCRRQKKFPPLSAEKSYDLKWKAVRH